jgi:nucleoside-diphosphate-sugar epimerase
VGLALGRELVRQGHEVFGVRRSAGALEELKAAGIKLVAGDVTQPCQLKQLPSGCDWVVNLVSSSKGGPEDYRKAYFEGTRNLIDWLASAPPRKFVYTSSTSVYGQNDGSQVKESSPTEPTVDTARILVETEKLLLDAARERRFPSVILRVAGIYGPERIHYLRQFIGNQVKIPGQGERFLNMIHRDDLIGIILAALKNGRAGEVYNAVDDEPVMQVHFYRWLSETLGKWMPPFSSEGEAERKRRPTNKRVSNRKLKMELGYQFKYPTFRQGYTAEIQRLDQAGLLNIEPEVR